MLGFSQHMDPRLFGREIIFKEFQRMWSRYLNVTDRRTDRRLTVASPRSALASRGNKRCMKYVRRSADHLPGSIEAANDGVPPAQRQLFPRILSFSKVINSRLSNCTSRLRHFTVIFATNSKHLHVNNGDLTDLILRPTNPKSQINLQVCHDVILNIA